MDKILKVEDLSSLPMNSLITLYKNGYRIEENIYDNYKKLEKIENVPMKIMGTSLCPSTGTIVRGSLKTISVVPTKGTPPYTLNWKVDNNIVYTLSNLQDGKSSTFTWNFNESIGSHIYSAEIVDSCPSGSHLDSSSCTVNIVEAATTPPPSIMCQPDQINIYGTCIHKNYLIYGGAGFIVLLLLTS